jgi:dihydrolipoamide dehydrogenase
MYDVIIIGGGPGGYVSGIRASQLGLKVCILEKNKPGGTCLNVGCIPTKSIIHQAGIFKSGNALRELGVEVNINGFDYANVINIAQKAVKKLVSGVEFLLKKNKVELIKQAGMIISKNTVLLEDGKEIQGKNIIIATGSIPIQLPGFEFDEKQVLSSTGLLLLEKLPKSLIILGAGAIGCEFAYTMNAFGVEVHLVEMFDHILPFEDSETVAVVTKSFKKKGINVCTGTSAVSLRKFKKSVTVSVAEKDGPQKKLKAEKVVCVFGRSANTENIGLENLGIKTKNRCIPVGDYFETEVRGIFAIGDVISSPQLAHLASKEGEIAVEYISGQRPQPRIDHNEVVSAIYCEPQIASFGLREDKAKEKGIKYKKASFPYAGLGKAVATDKSEGLVKVLFDPETRKILGAHIAGSHATELIHELLLAKTAELCPENIADMIHAHPTVSEGIMECMKAVDGQAIHI